MKKISISVVGRKHQPARIVYSLHQSNKTIDEQTIYSMIQETCSLDSHEFHLSITYTTTLSEYQSLAQDSLLNADICIICLSSKDETLFKDKYITDYLDVFSGYKKNPIKQLPIIIAFDVSNNLDNEAYFEAVKQVAFKKNIPLVLYNIEDRDTIEPIINKAVDVFEQKNSLNSSKKWYKFFRKEKDTRFFDIINPDIDPTQPKKYKNALLKQILVVAIISDKPAFPFYGQHDLFPEIFSYLQNEKLGVTATKIKQLVRFVFNNFNAIQDELGKKATKNIVIQSTSDPQSNSLSFHFFSKSEEQKTTAEEKPIAYSPNQACTKYTP